MRIDECPEITLIRLDPLLVSGLLGRRWVLQELEVQYLLSEVVVESVNLFAWSASEADNDVFIAQFVVLLEECFGGVEHHDINLVNYIDARFAF